MRSRERLTAVLRTVNPSVVGRHHTDICIAAAIGLEDRRNDYRNWVTWYTAFRDDVSSPHIRELLDEAVHHSNIMESF